MRASVIFLLSMLVALAAGCSNSDDSGQLITRVDIASQEIQSVAISGAEETISIGADLDLQLLANSGNGGSTSVTALAQWTSSDPAIATVSESGLLLGIADGTVSVNAQYGPFSDTVSVRISSAPLVAIAVTAPLEQLNACTSLQLTAEGSYLNEDTPRDITDEVEWQLAEGQQELGSFSDTVDATTGQRVDPAGFLRTTGFGDIQVSASLGDEVPPGVLSLMVLDSLDDGDITISGPDDAITVGAAVPFAAIATFNDGAANVDISDNALWTLTVNEGTAQFASVSNTLPDNGTVIATQTGGGTLSVSCGGVSAERAVRAEIPPSVDRVFISPDEDDRVITVNVDADTIPLRGIVQFTDGSQQDITEDAEWTVDSSGDVRALQLSDSSGTRGVVTINSIGEIEVTMTYERGGIVYDPVVTVRAEVF